MTHGLIYTDIGIYFGPMARTPTTADAFNAIAEASRRDLLSAIGTDEVTVNELVSRTRMGQPRVQALERASCCRSGAGARAWATSLVPRQWRGATPVHDWVAAFESAWNERLDRLDTLLTELKVEKS